MTTKEQERKALEKIRNIVAELGEDSYLATAFDGAFSLADQNIEYDAAFSTQWYIDKANDFDREAKRYQKEIEDAQRNAEMLQADLAAAKEKAIPAQLYRWLWTFVTGEHDAAKELMASAADEMAAFAHMPQDIAFVRAVENYRKRKERREWCEQMITGLELIEPENV